MPSPLPASTGSHRAPGAGQGRWAGREDPKPHPGHPHPCPCCQSWGRCCLHGWKRGKKGGKKGEGSEGARWRCQRHPQRHLPAKATWSFAGGSLGMQQTLPHGTGLQSPSRHSNGSCTPAQMQHTHGVRGRQAHSSPAHPAVPVSLLEQKGDGSDPQGESRGKL